MLISPPGPTFRVGGGPYTVPLSITDATRISTVTLTLVYDPTKLRVRTVQEGSFMRAGGVAVAFTQQANGNRVDITLARGADATGASGTGLLAGDAVRRHRARQRDADAERRGHRARRHGDGPAVPAGHGYGAVSR